ncbi:MAG: hypothetical protein KY476_14385 [Planctomycetes bacterium]|nr:hypothetical protein [Planctomycetota bacterium]
MGRKRAANGPNRSEAIRDYLKAHPDATPKQVVAGLSEQGVTVTTGLVYKVKSSSGLGGSRRRRVKRRKRTTAPQATPTAMSTAGASAGAGLTAQDLFAAKQFTDNVGGLKAARQALDALERLR